jgi:4-hydroxybenzoate polyprenyltransferase
MPVRGLAAACHPLPCLAVAAFAGAWAAVTGLSPDRVALLAAAVLLGQLSVGWSNDWVDAVRDQVAGRPDKPIAAGLVGRRTVGAAAACAAGACAVASLSLGPAAGAVHLLAVASAWAYNLGVKSTSCSPLPYAVSFGLLPGVATWAGAGSGWPALGVTLGAALLGVAAHFANTVPDAVADAATGVRGLPQRLGPRRSLQVMAGCVTAAAISLLPAGRRSDCAPPLLLVAGGLLVAGAVLAAALAVAGERAGARAFRLTLVAVALVVAGFLMSA